MFRTLNSIVALVAALAMILLVGACEAPPPRDENAIEYENAVEENVASDGNALDVNAVDTVDEGTDEAAPPIDEAPATDTGPDDEAEEGVGAFKSPDDMEVDNWYTVEFFVAPDEPGLKAESEGIELTAPTAVYVAPAMRVTLQEDPTFEIRPKSAAVVMTGRDKEASWQWDVKPLTGGERTLFATVEVLQRNADGSLQKNPDGTLVASESKTRRVNVVVKVGTWRGFLTAIQNATTLGDVLGTLFSAWQKTLAALAALIAAALGVRTAVRRFKSPKDPVEPAEPDKQEP